MDDIRYIAHITVRPACSTRLCAQQKTHLNLPQEELLLGLIESDLIRGVSDKRRDIAPATRRTGGCVCRLLSTSHARETRQQQSKADQYVLRIWTARVWGSAANSFELVEGGRGAGNSMRTSVSYQQAWKWIRAKYASGAAGLVSFQVEAGRLIKGAEGGTQKKVKIFFLKQKCKRQNKYLAVIKNER